MSKHDYKKPPTNYRRTWPRVCDNCNAFYNSDYGWMRCGRPRGSLFDTGDGKYREMVCDRFEQRR